MFLSEMHATDVCDNTSNSCSAIHAEGSSAVQIGLRLVQICPDCSRGLESRVVQIGLGVVQSYIQIALEG